MIRKLILGLTLAGALGAAAYADQCVPDPNAICYQIYAPVVCNNGVTYTNQCYADAACARGCHPV
ncbi:MAG TPA: hypothetical protein VLB76_17755 [Thermoanaerobaculia bacterium]|jgi:hypothetical protein|nr:hypothetical protein [Thermoanaerobaculia bacterium]